MQTDVILSLFYHFHNPHILPETQFFEFSLTHVSFYNHRHSNRILILQTDNKILESLVLELEIIEASYHILSLLYKDIKPDTSTVPNTSLYEDTIKSMVTYIGEHFQEKLSLDDIAFSAGLNSTIHFTETFRKIVGCTPNQFRNITGKYRSAQKRGTDSIPQKAPTTLPRVKVSEIPPGR